MEILKIEKLRKSFKNMTAVDGLSLSIEAGEVHGILGPNGAGKSTTINCILGLLAADAGTVSFEGGHTIKKWGKNIGYVPQDLAIYPELTPIENIRFFCSLYGYTGNELKERVETALEFVGLEEVRNKKSGEFSGGMKRRLNMACGIAHSPKLIIMDEPTVGIDPQSRNRILENVHALNEAGATILYTTHYMPEVEEICNKITVIDHGTVIATGTKADIMSRMGKDMQITVEFVKDAGELENFIHQMASISDVHNITENEWTCKITHPENVTMIDKVIEFAMKNHLVIQNITKQEPSLEEVFLSLTGKELRDGK